MVIDMERDLTNILTEVLIFPYEQSVVDALTDACSSFVEAIEIGQYEDCVLHLCLDIPATDFIEHVNTQTGRRFPDRVYRALAGYVVGEALATVSDEDDKVMFSLALRNALKAKTDDADGIISKTIDPASFSAVEDYWAENINIPSLCGKDVEDWKNKIRYYLQHREEADSSAAKFRGFLESECSEEKYAKTLWGMLAE